MIDRMTGAASQRDRIVVYMTHDVCEYALFAGIGTATFAIRCFESCLYVVQQLQVFESVAGLAARVEKMFRPLEHRGGSILYSYPQLDTISSR